jgi:hypothetical protein
MIDKYLVVTPKDFTVGHLPDHSVAITFSLPAKETGLAAGLGLTLSMSPTEARRFALALTNAADGAEVGLPRA